MSQESARDAATEVMRAVMGRKEAEIGEGVCRKPEKKSQPFEAQISGDGNPILEQHSNPVNNLNEPGDRSSPASCDRSTAS